MEYFDELDSSAVEALLELGGEDFSFQPASTTPAPTPTQSSRRRHRHMPVTYLLRLEHPLATPLAIANAIGLTRVPKLEKGDGEDGETHFCRLSQDNVDALDLWASQNNARFTKIRIGMAHKEKILPKLGWDSTLPHHRPTVTTKERDCEAEFESPVDYFFYGTLAETALLSRLFNIPEDELPSIRKAYLLDGKIQTWASKYRALTDAPGGRVEGVVFPVISEEQEDALRVYEGDSYEIVEARIMSERGEVRGRTFRFCGYEDELS